MSNRNIIDKIYLINTGSIIDNIINNNQTIQETKDEVININNNLTYINETIGIINNEIENINSLDEEQNNKLNNIDNNINDINNEIENINTLDNEQNNRLDSINSSIDSVNSSINSVNSSINNINNELDSVNSLINTINNHSIETGYMNFTYNTDYNDRVFYYIIRDNINKKGIIFLHFNLIELNFKNNKKHVLVFEIPEHFKFIINTYVDVISYYYILNDVYNFKHSMQRSTTLNGEETCRTILFYTDSESLANKDKLTYFRFSQQVIKMPINLV